MNLPPLASLRFFEATARHLSVKLAAQELHVTSGAVTQQVHKLEDFLGCELFERRVRGLSLTAHGQSYLLACQDALGVLERATSQITASRQAIVVSCTPGFAAQWLVPRLQGFLDAQPTLDVHVSTTNRLVDLARESVHFAVRHGLGSYSGLLSEKLLDDELIPVCSPRLIAPRRAATLADITSARLLHDGQRKDWKLWGQMANLRGLNSEKGVVFVDSNAAMEAAIAGRGVALARRSLVESELASRRLIAIKAPPLQATLAYYLVYRVQTLEQPAMRSFHDWITAQAAATQA